MSDDLIADAAQVAQEYQAAIAQETLNLRHAEQANDFAARRESMRSLAALRATAKEFDQMCREHHQAVTSAPKPHPDGLTPEQDEFCRLNGISTKEFRYGLDMQNTPGPHRKGQQLDLDRSGR